jgi:hypothetical protein
MTIGEILNDLAAESARLAETRNGSTQPYIDKLDGKISEEVLASESG